MRKRIFYAGASILFFVFVDVIAFYLGATNIVKIIAADILAVEILAATVAFVGLVALLYEWAFKTDDK